MQLRQFKAYNYHLFPFLHRHKSSLKHLKLDRTFSLPSKLDLQNELKFNGRYYDDVGTHKAFLTDIRETLNLQKVDVVIPGPSQRIYDWEWNRVSIAKHSSEARYFLHTQLLEWYVKGQSTWPMKGEDPDGYWLRRPRADIYAGLDQSLHVSLENLLENEPPMYQYLNGYKQWVEY